MDSISKPSTARVSVLPKRRESRLLVALEVRILGIDARGKAFHQSEVTVDISLSGARITGLTAALNVGDIVGLQSSGDKSRFKVSWVRPNESDGTFEVGLHCLEKGKAPWRDKIQQLNPGERRGGERYPCEGTVSLRSTALPTPIWGTMHDISEGGCYVRCVNVAPSGEIVSGQFILNGVQIDGVAEVSSSQAMLGMGLLWCDLGWDGQEKLNRILHALSLNSGETNLKMRALAQLERIQGLVMALRARMESSRAQVDVQTIAQVGDAEEKLIAALKSVQP